MKSAMVAKSKRRLEYEIGEYVKIHVPKIDRFGTDRFILPCKILNKLNYNNTFKYSLGCQNGILNNLYYAREMEPLGVKEFPELENIPTDTVIYLLEKQDETRILEHLLEQCASKGSCNTNKRRCKKVGIRCGSKCHSGKCVITRLKF
ncbi:6212_t:CDS:1 [Gigaspora margarita]|uniref:6212_t:CDS:1 n=1 Tax=Gigaspora margarita TaxID=4874 RepID=A0ABM8W396_GIGMA|nr:6212_t:CDS:1 [Gigaspora margarita]